MVEARNLTDYGFWRRLRCYRALFSHREGQLIGVYGTEKYVLSYYGLFLGSRSRGSCLPTSELFGSTSHDLR